MKIFFKISIILIVLCTSFISCKKSNNTVKNYSELVGGWEETPSQSYRRRLLFDSDGSFTMELVNGTIVNYNGTYKIDGNKVIINVKETAERTAAGTTIKTSVNYILFEKATFEIRNRSILTLSYITYPADAPVETKMVFNKLLTQ